MRLLILKEEYVQEQTRSTLDVIYENWRTYHEKLRDCIALLANEQLLLQPAAHMWPLGQMVQHMSCSPKTCQVEMRGSSRCCWVCFQFR